MTTAFSIHLIDDGLALCRDLCGWLEQAGYAVVCSQPTRAAMSQLTSKSPALLIIGMATSSGAGFDFCQRLSGQRQLRHLPVIVVSDDPDLEYELLDVYDFQARPIDRVRLLNVVARVAASDALELARPFAARELEPVTELLHRHSGLHFSTSNRRLLERGLQRRMQALQITSPQRYFDFLSQSQNNQDEFNKLVGLLTVGETCFFRYRSHHDALVHNVLPELLTRNAASRRLRVWSAGCSTGEEPYSLAMKLLENFPRLHDWDVQILATDINKRSLRKAREGIYRERALRQAEPRYRERYFRQTGDCFVLDHKVRSLVRFAYCNLQADEFPDPHRGTSGLDLIFCRNVLIYFRPETIRQIVARFADCLNPGGYLFLGHAETLQYISDRFVRHHQHGAFYYQLKAPSAPKPPVVPAPIPLMPLPTVEAMVPVVAKPAPPLPLPTAPRPEPPDPEKLYQQGVAAFEHEDFAAAGQLFDRVLAAAPDHARALVGKGLLCANQGQYQEARQWCARAICSDDLCPEAYLLRGLILDMEGQFDRALVEYQKVLWLERDFIMAHYFSARCHDQLNQDAQQIRSLRNAMRCLEKSAENGIIPFSGGMSRPVLLELCRQQLAAIQADGTPP